MDIAVPGELSIGAYSPDTYYSQFRFNMIQGSGGMYGLQNAVSGAAPTLTGTIALMLEVNPNLTVDQVRDILHQSARSDAFTGTTPNPEWGYGKLDAFAAIQATYNTLSLEQTSLAEMGIRFFPNPTAGEVNYEWETFTSREPARIDLLDTQGRRISSFNINQSSGKMILPHLSPGVYLLSVTAGSRVSFFKILKI
ncbi:MAG: S8 family peptidase [Bacteroidia bacterium]